MNIFNKKQYIELEKNKEATGPSIPDGLWFKCKYCGSTIYRKYVNVYKICPKCNSYYRMSARRRIKLTIDKGSFQHLNENLIGSNPLDYPDYGEKLKEARDRTNIKEAVVTGTGKINGIDIAIGAMDPHFIMASMGSGVGEKLTRLFEYATEKNLPVIVFSASGGARMQEGIVSLMQMAKVSMAIKRHSDKGLLYISFLTDPTTGGVTASFASLGDIILAEPKALIGFAGRRVIEQTINEKLPKDFQSAEKLLERGFVDKIVERESMKDELYTILKLHGGGIND